MNIKIEDENKWREKGAGKRLDVLRAYIEDKSPYLEDLRQFFASNGEISEDSTDVIIEYHEADPEFQRNHGEFYFCGSFVPKDYTDDVCPWRKDGSLVHFLVKAVFTNLEHIDWGGRDRYCSVVYTFCTLLGTPEPPAWMGIVLEAVNAKRVCHQ